MADEVAPLAGSVDRNDLGGQTDMILRRVAPLAGSVDRNTPPRIASAKAAMSLPSRGAWIEIYSPDFVRMAIPSLPSRGAWIEITVAIKNLLLGIGRSPRGERG